jgi:hypothetical protein
MPVVKTALLAHTAEEAQSVALIVRQGATQVTPEQDQHAMNARRERSRAKRGNRSATHVLEALTWTSRDSRRAKRAIPDR